MVDIDITGQYQINGVPIGGSSNPSVIDISVTNGIPATGNTAVTASRILLVPANTFTTNGMLEMVARCQKTGTGSAFNTQIYLNTSPTLTGATQIAVFGLTSSTLIQGIRTARISSNILTIWPILGSVVIDYASNSNLPASATFNTAIDNYIIFATNVTNTLDSAVIEMARIVKYLEV
jgi:hypothetical protein